MRIGVPGKLSEPQCSTHSFMSTWICTPEKVTPPFWACSCWRGQSASGTSLRQRRRLPMPQPLKRAKTCGEFMCFPAGHRSEKHDARGALKRCNVVPLPHSCAAGFTLRTSWGLWPNAQDSSSRIVQVITGSTLRKNGGQDTAACLRSAWPRCRYLRSPVLPVLCYVLGASTGPRSACVGCKLPSRGILLSQKVMASRRRSARATPANVNYKEGDRCWCYIVPQRPAGCHWITIWACPYQCIC